MNVWNFFWSTSSDVDKGWALVVLLTTFITYGFGWGFISSIGIFYSIWIDEFNASKATIAWITSLPVFFLYLTTPIVVSLRKYTKSYQVLGFVGITLCSSSLARFINICEQPLLVIFNLQSTYWYRIFIITNPTFAFVE